jgi:tetratricopeptide (TPR) repeat protein
MSEYQNKGDDTKENTSPLRPAGAVGYKQPPLNSRFKKGKSGNSKGRPRGRPNVATLTKAIFNKTVPVREGDKTRHMPVCEAIVRSQVGKAGQGDARALFTVMDLLEMTGRTNEISDDERAKRGMHLSAPFSREEFDLLHAEARERERHTCQAMAESNPARYATSDDGTSTVVIVPPAIKAGDEVAAEGKLDGAFADYRRELARCRTELIADDSNKQAQGDFRRAVGRIGLLADKLLLAGEFAQAINFADEALAEGATPFWVAPRNAIGIVSANTVWISAIRAHARMFLGCEDEARTFYLSFHSNKRLTITSWETAILQDFARLRAAGRSHRLMDEIEKRFADEGWTTTQPGNKMTHRPEMKGEDSVFIQMHPDDIKSGDLLDQHGKPEGAAATYVRNLKRCQAKLKLGGTSPAGEAHLQIAVGRIECMARKFLHAGHFALALENVEEAIAAAPDKLELHAIRAHALMFVDRDNDARTLFLHHRGQKIGDQPWEAAILEGFEAQRKAGRSRPLMDAIEKEFAAGGTVQTTANYTSPGNNGGTSVSALVQSSDIQSGEILRERGMLDEALVVYLRCLQSCNAKIAKFDQGQINNRAIDDRNNAIYRICGLATNLLRGGDFVNALGAADCALSAVPNTLLDVIRAHAIMLLDRADEARTLYLQCRGKKVDGGQSAESLILQDFAAMRKAELTCPLMDEVEKLFTEGAKNGPASA